MNKLDEIKSVVESKLDLIKDKVIVFKSISPKTWIIIGILFAFLSAFWEWIVGWLGYLILGRPFFIYPFSSLKYTDPVGIATWGAFAATGMFIAMQATKFDTVKNLKKILGEDYSRILDFLKDKFVLPKKLPFYAIIIAGVVGAIVGTTCEGLWGFILQFVKGHIVWIYPSSILKYTSFASIPIWGVFGSAYFVLTHKLILVLEKHQHE
jgi:hypothetical protein